MKVDRDMEGHEKNAEKRMTKKIMAKKRKKMMDMKKMGMSHKEKETDYMMG